MNNIDSLLNNVRSLLAKSNSPSSPTSIPVPPRHKPTANQRWFAVRWDYDECAFDISTIRHEPEQGRNPRLFRQPLLWPWIYLPVHAASAPDTDTASPTNLVLYLNSRLRGRPALSGLQNTSLKSKDDFADIVKQVGGVLILNSPDGIRPDVQPRSLHIQTKRSKEPVVRPRAQTQRHTRSLRRGRQLSELSSGNRETVSTARLPATSGNQHRPLLRVQISNSRTTPRVTSPPVPEPILHAPGHRRRGESEDQFRERMGLETIADQIIAAIGLKNEPQN